MFAKMTTSGNLRLFEHTLRTHPQTFTNRPYRESFHSFGRGIARGVLPGCVVTFLEKYIILSTSNISCFSWMISLFISQTPTNPNPTPILLIDASLNEGVWWKSQTLNHLFLKEILSYTTSRYVPKGVCWNFRRETFMEPPSLRG